MRRFRALLLTCLLVGLGATAGHAAATDAATDRGVATAPVQTNTTAPDVNGNGDPATDTDGDGYYEDVDGDGFTACDDADTFEQYYNTSTVQNNVDLFDFDEDGTVGAPDVATLTEEMGGCDDAPANGTYYQGPIVDGDDPATDTDGDGLYDDLNGDGVLDAEDPEVLSANIDADIVIVNTLLFDFNGDEDVSEADVETLQEEVDTTSDTTSDDSLDVNGDGNDATDTDGDGLYEDIDGDGVADSQDPETLATYSNTSVVRNNVGKFDFDGDGVISDGDVETLSEEVADSEGSTDDDLPTLTDANEPVTDTDGDGLYEDANGNGEFECGADIEIFQSSADTVVEYPKLFDFNGDGSVDFEEEVAMLREMYGCAAPDAAAGGATESGDRTTAVTTTTFERGFFSNDRDSSVPVLGDPSALTMIGIVLSVVGILLELRGG